MAKLTALRDAAHLQFVLPADEGEIAPWLPVSHTEFHLASLYFPLAVRFEDGLPVLGLILSARYSKRAPLDAARKWQGGYRPIALRCAPFDFAAGGANPLDMLLKDPSRDLAEAGGIPIVDRNGEPSPLIREIHRWSGLLQETNAKFAPALDQLLIANLLVPLAAADEISDEPPLYIIDGARFTACAAKAFAAMSRHRFTAIDIAAACLSSQRLLQEKYRPQLEAKPPQASAPPLADLAIECLDLALDEGELISLADIEVLRGSALT